jgi:hypothetical protein
MKNRLTQPEQVRRHIHLPVLLIRPFLPLLPNLFRESVVGVRAVWSADEEGGDVEEVGIVGFDGDVAVLTKRRKGLAGEEEREGGRGRRTGTTVQAKEEDRKGGEGTSEGGQRKSRSRGRR